MDDATRHSLLQLLGKAMSDISEDCYHAGWMDGAEYIVPEWCRRAVATGRPQFWGMGEVKPERAIGLIWLAGQLGSWADLDRSRGGYIPHPSLPIPPKYADVIESQHATPYLA